jgi:hypothetical protein
MAGLLFAPLACDEGEEGTTQPPPTPDPGSVTVNVSVEGTGLAGISIALSGASSQSGVTGQGGNFTFPSVPVGSYTVTISGFPADISFAETPKSVTVTEGASAAAAFAGSFIRTASITGTVTADAGGIENVAVQLTGTEEFTTTTNASGQYQFTGLRAGNYSVEISGFPVQVRFPFTKKALQLGVGDAETVDFVGNRQLTASVSIKSITVGATNVPVTPSNVAGKIDVTLSIDKGQDELDQLQLYLCDLGTDPQCAGGDLVYTQTFTQAQSGPEAVQEDEVVVPFETDLFNGYNGPMAACLIATRTLEAGEACYSPPPRSARS